MKAILMFFLLINEANCSDTNTTAPTVYVCASQKAKKYHYQPGCRGLSNCSYKIVKIPLERAKREGKTLCQWEK